MKYVFDIRVRFPDEKAEQFEEMFQAEVLPLWHEFIAAGKFVSAQLLRVVDADDAKPGLQDYLIHVALEREESHDEWETDPRFMSFLDKARPMQPEEPLVRVGESIFEV